MLLHRYQQRDFQYFSIVHHTPYWPDRFDLLAGLRPGGSVLLNAHFTSAAEAEAELPIEFRRELSKIGAKLYVVDASRICRESGIPGKVSELPKAFAPLMLQVSAVLQPAFCYLTNVIGDSNSWEGCVSKSTCCLTVLFSLIAVLATSCSTTLRRNMEEEERRLSTPTRHVWSILCSYPAQLWFCVKLPPFEISTDPKCNFSFLHPYLTLQALNWRNRHFSRSRYRRHGKTTRARAKLKACMLFSMKWTPIWPRFAQLKSCAFIFFATFCLFYLLGWITFFPRSWWRFVSVRTRQVS